MDVTINTISEVRQEAEIRLSQGELQPHFDKAYHKYQPKVELRGFRKGRVPLEMVKKLYGDAIEHEALDEVATEVYREAMNERQIKPLGTPSMVDMDFKRGEQFHFKIQYDVKPVISLGSYKGITIEKTIHTVADEEIDEEALCIINGHGTEARGADVIVDASLNDPNADGSPWDASGPAFEVIANSLQAAHEAAHPGVAYAGPYPVGMRLAVQPRDRVRFVAIRDLPASEVLVLINRS